MLHVQSSFTTRQNRAIFRGIALALAFASVAKYLSLLPIFSTIGQLVLAILLGMIWRTYIGVSEQTLVGTNFSSKVLLRLGIIFLGVRLNWFDIIQAGGSIFLIATLSLVFTLIVVYLLSKLFSVKKNIGILVACGTAICGAAAVVAISPQLKAKDEEIAISAATVAILGTLFTLIYTVTFPLLGLSDIHYGVFAGATLHEIAHVLAAASVGGTAAEDTAVIVKLTRVALLVPVAILIGVWMHSKQPQDKKVSKHFLSNLPIPWFILGFLMMSGGSSLDVLSPTLIAFLETISYLFIAMAMAGLGLHVQLSQFRKSGVKPLLSCFIGSVLLALFGWITIQIFLVM